jgi:molybdate transport system substrate-binding protein
VLPELEAGFLVSHPDVKFTFNFAGSQQLVQQLVQGAKADLFISADHKQIDTASQAGIITDGDAIPLAGNSLVVVTPFDNPGQIQNLLGLATPGIKLVIGAAEVPVGAYTLDFLDKAAANPDYGIDYKTQVLANVVSYEENVRAVLSKVILGEADAGIVYLTDALMAGPTQVTSLEIPQNLNIYATYWLAYLKESQQEILSHQFLEYLLSEEGQLILVMRGFLPVQ